MRPNRLREPLRAEILFDCFKREGETMRNILEGR
jgi:hypothetical protein